MRSSSIEGVHICLKHTTKMALGQDQEMIETLPADTAEEVLAAGIGPGSSKGSSEYLNPAGYRDASQLRTVLAVVITDQIARFHTKRGRFTQLLGDPLVGRMLGHAQVDY
jgi:hypothetical protein